MTKGTKCDITNRLTAQNGKQKHRKRIKNLKGVHKQFKKSLQNKHLTKRAECDIIVKLLQARPKIERGTEKQRYEESEKLLYIKASSRSELAAQTLAFVQAS